jgi:HEAT repeat protein
MVTAQICNNCDINSHMNSTATATMGPVATQDAPVTLTADRRTGQKTIVVDGRHLLGSLLSLRRIQNGQRDESWFYPWARFTGIKIPDDARSVEEVPNDVLACLYHALGDDAEGVRATALVAMSMCSSAPSLAGRGMIGKLVGCMGDASGEVRAAAAEAIGRLGPDVLPYCQGVGPVNGRSNSSGMMLPAHLSSAPQTPTRRLRLDRVTDSTPVGGGSSSTSAMVRYSQHRNTTRSSRAPGFTPGSTRFRRARQPPDSSVTKSARKNSNSKNNAAERYAPPSDNAVLACLQTMLQDRLHCVRHAACIAIGHLGAAANEIAMDLLRVMDQGKVTRGVGGRALVKLAPTGQQLLLDLLCNARCQTKGGEKTRIAAAVGLGCMREDATLFDATVRVLFDVCRDPKPGVRAAALYALGKLGVKTEERVLYLRARSLLPFVYSHLRDKDKVVRLAAAKVLARAAPQGEMLLIEGLLQDKEEKVRVAITHGLSVVGPACIRTMMLALSDRSDAVREAAANVILGFGAEMIAEELKKRSSASRESLAHEIRALVQDTRKAFPAELDQLFLVLVGRIQGFTVYG